jgi:methylthioribose-1-phosphate isomerase
MIKFKTVEWLPADKKIRLIDQTKLPGRLEYIVTNDYRVMCDAIKRLAVRGAPAIGVAGAYSVVIGALSLPKNDFTKFSTSLHRIMDELRATRPTAVNLFWAIDRMERVLNSYPGHDVNIVLQGLTDEAIIIHHEDEEMCRKIGEHGAELLEDGMTILTHCNAGSLATGGMGTALAPIYIAQELGKIIKVYADETRPLLQGARLTSWELKQNGIEVTLICDNMAAVVMRKGWINAVIVGSDRIAVNGDFANKIGTYTVALLAKHHGIPFYVAAPTSTIDTMLPSGDRIPIEERNEDEVAGFNGCRTAPEEVKTYNPAFDVTPHQLVSAIITERGVHYPPFDFSTL